MKVLEQDHMYTMNDLMYARHNVENFRGSHFKFVVAKLSEISQILHYAKKFLLYERFVKCRVLQLT